MRHVTWKDYLGSAGLILGLMLAGLLLALCSIAHGAEKVCDPENPEHCSQPLLQDEKAPFAGQLLTTKLAIDQATKAHDCEAVTEMVVGEAQDSLQLKLDREIALRAIDLRTAAAREEVLRKAAERAQEAAERAWWESPTLWYVLGVFTGVAATVGAVYAGVEITKANR